MADEIKRTNNNVKKYQDRKTSLHFTNLHQDGRNYDFFVRFNSTTHSLHREVLMSNDYLKQMIISRSNRPMDILNLIRIENKEITNSIFATVLEYLYTGCISLSDENIMPVYHAAHYFMEPRIIDHCRHFLEYILTVDNVLGYLSVAMDNKVDDAAQFAKSFCCKNFDALIEGEALNESPVHVIVTLFESSDLVLYDEGVILNACCKWLGADYGSRQVYMAELFGTLRFGCLSHTSICNSLTFMNEKMERYLRKILVINQQQHQDLDESARKYWSGIYLKKKAAILHYTPASKELNPVCKIPFNSASSWTLALDGKLYFIRRYTHTIKCFDLAKRIWLCVAPLPKERNDFSAFSHDGKLYLFTNGTTKSPLICQIYTPETNTWTITEPSFEGVLGHGRSASISLGKLFLICQFYLSGVISLHLYNPVHSVGRRFAPLLPCGSYHHLIEYKEHILFFGYFPSLGGVGTGNKLVLYNFSTKSIAQCSMNGLFESSDFIDTPQRFGEFLLNDLNIVRHNEHVYFIENGREGSKKSHFVSKRVNLEEMLIAFRPNFNLASIAENVDLCGNFEVLSAMSV